MVRRGLLRHPGYLPALQRRCRGRGQVATSDGRLFHAPDTARLEARKRRYQRRMARQIKTSRRRRITKGRLRKTQRRIFMKRRDWQHHVSRELAIHTAAVEDLRVRGMTASAKGTAAQPGKGAKAKAGLNRVILDTGWGSLRTMLEQKAPRVIAVNPAYTSRTCHACGVESSRSRFSRDRFRCVACRHAAHADLNAARNIRRRGLALLRGEAAGLPGLRTARMTDATAA